MLRRSNPLIRNNVVGPITVVDIGCRGGLAEEFASLHRLVRLIGFDADAEECARINSEPHDLYSREVFPVFIGAENGESDFHLFKVLAESSALLPDPRYAALFRGPGEFAVDRTVRVETSTLDTFYETHEELTRPDFIKLDTQGTELDVLNGARECLRTASMVESEIEFLPLYQNQCLFEDVLGFMRDQGFDLLYLNRLFNKRKSYRGRARGQLTFGDAVFGRREDRLDDLDDDAVARYLLMLINIGCLDVAHSILQKRKLPTEVREIFQDWLTPSTSRFQHVARFWTRWFDKLLVALLHVRRDNALPLDSDRSWPFR